MRVLILMGKYCPWSRSTAAAIQGLGHQVHVVDFSDEYGEGYINSSVPGIRKDADALEKMVSGVHLVDPPLKNKTRYVLGAFRLHQLAKRLEVDAVLSLEGTGFALLAFLSGFRPYFMYAVGSEILFAGRVKRCINRILMTSATKVLANGDFLAVRAREQAPKARIEKLLLGVDPSRFHMADLSKKPIQIICTRGFQDVYNNEMIIRSLALLPDNIPEFQFIFTSAGPLLEGMVGLADRIVPARIREKIVFWKGVSYESILEGLCQSHIFVSMSKSDGTSTALLEALASGLYPILSDIPQNREWVNPIEGNGILIALNSVESLTIALDKCVRQIGNLRKYSHYNIALVNERANAKINREHLVRVIEKSISENRGRQ